MEDNKLIEEIKEHYDKIELEKVLVERTMPSEAVKELEDMAEQVELMVENTDKIFRDSYMLKYLEFKAHIVKLQKPEDVAAIFCQDMGHALK